MIWTPLAGTANGGDEADFTNGTARNISYKIDLSVATLRRVDKVTKLAEISAPEIT
jgi:hypothetical protein